MAENSQPIIFAVGGPRGAGCVFISVTLMSELFLKELGMRIYSQTRDVPPHLWAQARCSVIEITPRKAQSRYCVSNCVRGVPGPK